MNPNTITYDHYIHSACRGIIFDLDDTLFPKHQYILSGYQAVSNYVYTLYGFHVYAKLVERYQAGETSDIFRKTLRPHIHEVHEGLTHKLLHVYLAHQPSIEFYTDVRPCMASLTSRNIRIGLLTDGYASIQRKKVLALELEPVLDSIVYSDDLIGGRASWKPCPDPFYIMGLQIGLEFQEMIYIADNPTVDFVTPRKLGMGTIRIRRHDAESAHTLPPSSEYAPHATIDSLEELLKVIEITDFNTV